MRRLQRPERIQSLSTLSTRSAGTNGRKVADGDAVELLPDADCIVYPKCMGHSICHRLDYSRVTHMEDKASCRYSMMAWIVPALPGECNSVLSLLTWFQVGNLVPSKSSRKRQVSVQSAVWESMSDKHCILEQEKTGYTDCWAPSSFTGRSYPKPFHQHCPVEKESCRCRCQEESVQA